MSIRADLREAFTPNRLALVAGVLLIQLAFIWSYVGAFHSPKPSDIPVAVVAPAQQAGQIAAQPPQALRMAKALMRQGRDQTFEQILELSAALQALAHQTEDHLEGVAAVLEKRPADFAGR